MKEARLGKAEAAAAAEKAVAQAAGTEAEAEAEAEVVAEKAEVEVEAAVAAAAAVAQAAGAEAAGAEKDDMSEVATTLLEAVRAVKLAKPSLGLKPLQSCLLSCRDCCSLGRIQRILCSLCPSRSLI